VSSAVTSYTKTEFVLASVLLALKESGEKIFVRPKKEEKYSFGIKREWRRKSLFLHERKEIIIISVKCCFCDN